MKLRNLPRRLGRAVTVLRGGVPALPGDMLEAVPAAPIDPWITAHYVDVVHQFVTFVAPEYDIKGKSLVDIGCGDGLIDYGLLNTSLGAITGLDIVPESEKSFAGLPDRIRNAGHTPPTDISRYNHVDYDGVNMPFADQSFDIVFSWSAFEHVQEVDKVMAEVVRVMKNDGFAFIQVFPWFASRHGSHLTDHISDSFFHLREEHAATRKSLEKAAKGKPELKEFMLGHLWTEFTYLNKISADDFYDAARRSGLVARKVHVISHDEDLVDAPDEYSLSQLMVAGTIMVLTKK